ncbi:MAG: ATP synthase F1 subunit epsilon [Actinomycetota bacterium]|nr:ATP synthase F1 subunit epsilon [Actinomycetota bacterium]
MPLQVELVSPDRMLFSDEAEMVICRTPAGEIAFMAGHVPFLGALGIGIVRIHKEGGDVEKMAVHEGFVQVKEDRVIILSDVAERADQIDTDRARRAKEEAESDLKSAGEDDEEAEKHKARARRAEVRLELAEG